MLQQAGSCDVRVTDQYLKASSHSARREPIALRNSARCAPAVRVQQQVHRTINTNLKATLPPTAFTQSKFFLNVGVV